MKYILTKMCLSYKGPCAIPHDASLRNRLPSSLLKFHLLHVRSQHRLCFHIPFCGYFTSSTYLSRSFLNATGLANPPPFPSLIFSFLFFPPLLPRNCFLAQDGSKADLSSVSASGPALHFSISRCPGTEVPRIDIKSRELGRLEQREL